MNGPQSTSVGPVSPTLQFRPTVSRTGQPTLMVTIAGWSFSLVIVAHFLNLTRRFFVAYGFDIAELATTSAYGSIALLFVAILAYATVTGSSFGCLSQPGRRWWLALSLVLVLCAINGVFLREYALNAVANDAGPWLLFLGCIILGSIPIVWEQVDPVIFWLFLLAVVINTLGLREVERVLTYADAREGIQTVAYKTQWALSFWPYLLLTARQRSWPKMLAIFGGVLFYLIEQIIFQKRAPMGRLAIYALIFAFIVPRIATRWRSWNPQRERQVRQLSIAVAGAALLLVMMTNPGLLGGQLSGLVNRFAGKQYRAGAIGAVSENERFFEAGVMLRSLENHELIFGRGFGGYYPITGGLELITHPGAWLSDVQTFGRRELHVGALMPMLKGGLLLMFVYFSGVVYALISARKRLNGPINTAAYFIVLVSTLFLLQEGGFIMPHGFDLILVGLSLGRLLSDPMQIAAVAPRGDRIAQVA